MIIPERLALVLSQIPARLAQLVATLDAEIAALVAERDELIAALVAERDELVAPYRAPVDGGPRKHQVDAIMPRAVRGAGPRPERPRADGQPEYLYGHGGYTCAADSLGLGTVDGSGRWLTIPEWRRVRQEDHRRRAMSRERVDQ
jgi:hypothetical protein